jgi:hypothetical protein
MASDIRREAEDLVRYHGELVRRLTQAGVRDVAELLGLYDQLRRALDAVSRQEIVWAAEQTSRLASALEQQRTDLARLAELCSSVSPPHDAPLPAVGAVRRVPEA